MSETTMNLRGLKCPLPALRLRKKLSGLQAGDLIVAECTDPLTAIDVPHFVNQTGHALVSHERNAGLYLFTIVKRQYPVGRIVEMIGLDGKITDSLSDRRADCPRTKSPGLADACAASCSDLVRVRPS